jgi:F-type H+-transporting ATPase subunit a
MFAHLVPTGSPFGLLPFIVIIELLSSFIRPISLSVRLVANIVAGHLLITLLSSAVSTETRLFALAVILLGLGLLRVLETAVALIQAYVFSVLSTIYLSEVNTPIMSTRMA